MRRRLDSARHGFQRLRARLFEQRQCTDTIVKSAGEEVPRDASWHVRVAGTLGNRCGLDPERNCLDAKTAQLHKRMDLNDCVHVLSSEGAVTDATAKR